MANSAYIHIPFCEHICHYCDFNKVFLKGQPVDEYLQSLHKEMNMRASSRGNQPFKTIFVGGGTPTSLSERQLESFCQSIVKELPMDHTEFSFEANPGDLSEEKLKILKHYGVNRLSFGVQSFNDELLERIGRTHKSSEVYESIDKARKAGFTNISIDLIYSLPGQTLEDFKDTLEKALELELPHYSAYSLIIEPKTVFYNHMRKGKLRLPTEETEAEMYDLLIEEMEKAGMHQYEISNFSKKGYESLHNTVYWDNEEYYGFGAGAHGYLNNVRYSNHGPLKKYMAPLEEGNLPILSENPVSLVEAMEEEMFLGLRKTAGVSIDRFKEKFERDPLTVFEKPIVEMTNKKLLEVSENTIHLTKIGRFLGNEVFQAFIGVIND